MNEGIYGWPTPSHGLGGWHPVADRKARYSPYLDFIGYMREDCPAYCFVYEGILIESDTDNFVFAAAENGSNFIATGNQYKFEAIGRSSDGTDRSTSGNPSVGFLNNSSTGITNVNTYALDGWLLAHNPANASYYKNFEFKTKYREPAGAGNEFVSLAGGFHYQGSTKPIVSMRFFVTNGSGTADPTTKRIVSGIITMYALMRPNF